jgi:hypothetical protein
MTQRSRKDTTQTPTLSETDRNATIDRLYDVALDPSRYEALLDHWESAIGPLRAQADFHSPQFLDDPLIEGHFERAGTFLDRVDTGDETKEIEAILAPFDRVAAFVLDRSQNIRAANATAKTLMGLQNGRPLSDLPINPEDIEAVRRTLRGLSSDSPEDSAILRVRSLQKGHFMVLRLQRCATRDGTPLVLAASNEVGWPEGFRDILRKAFGLTGAEADVVRGLVECCSVSEISGVIFSNDLRAGAVMNSRRHGRWLSMTAAPANTIQASVSISQPGWPASVNASSVAPVAAVQTASEVLRKLQAMPTARIASRKNSVIIVWSLLWACVS